MGPMWQGGERTQEGLLTFQELCEKSSDSVSMLNASAVAHMFVGKFADAENLLMKAQSKALSFTTSLHFQNSSDVQTLQNLYVVSQHLRKPVEVSNRLSMYAYSLSTQPMVQAP
jgi:hypothetical protein